MSESNLQTIRCEGISVRYGRAFALDGVSLSVRQGAVYALLGRNGAGKSSLVRVLLGQQKPDRGSVSVFGLDSWRDRAAAMEKMGVVPEEPDVPPEMNAARLSDFCAGVHRGWSRSKFLERLGRFGISPATQFGRLSKGEKRQVSLAAALAHSPSLLVLDDPTLGLDVVARRSLFEEVIGELADSGITVFMTTHDLAGIESIADRVGILQGGRLLLDEDLETVKARFRRIRYDRMPEEAEERSAPWQTLTTRQWGAGLEAVVSNYDESEFERVAGAGNAHAGAMSLEEIFMAVAGKEGQK